ncbi:MAG: hypothetical protein HOV81_41060 [Kofleriaceae bacterium]|nr:hypothetical protein [Kofleriaceae bacterium]
MPSPSISVVPPEPEITVEDPVRAEHRAVIELFANQLAKVAFPDVDAALLRRQAEEVRAEAIAVARAREALEAAQHKLADRTAVLGDTVARGLAYARIYADAQPDRHALAASIAALAAPMSTTPAAPPAKRRGRPPRQSAELFATPAAEEPGS